MVFRHEPEMHGIELSTKGKVQIKQQVIGHYHPKIRKTISRRRFSGKCFVVTEDLFIMPAFGQFTGGLDVDEEVMLALASKKSRACYMLYDGTIFKA